MLVNVGKIIDSIKFAFPTNKNLEKLISSFKSQCKKITSLASEKEILIECGEKLACSRGHVLKYKDCFRTYSENGIRNCAVTNKQLFESLKISGKKKDIILGVMSKYIDYGNTKNDIIDHIINLFDVEMAEGNRLLKQIFEILDKDIKL